MQLAIPFPDFDPVLFTIPLVDLPIRWYALAYIAGIFLGWRYLIAMNARPGLWAPGKAPMDREQSEDILTWMVFGVIVGGRLGSVLFYKFDHYMQNPIEILQVWRGGMAFHGGFLGVITATLLFSWRQKVNPVSVGDLVAAVTPIGLFFGRIANFINGELWGRPTTSDWGVVFPSPAALDCPPGWVGVCTRHPSQLYQAAFEGLALFILLNIAIWGFGALKRPGRVIGLFFAGYGLARIVVENFRQADANFITPDNPWGHVLRLTPELGLTMGQMLSVPMLAIGLVILWVTRSR